MNGEDARVPEKAFLDQNVERPHRRSDDRVARGTKADDGAAEAVLENSLGAGDVVTKAVASELVHQAMGIAVTGDLVTGAIDLANQIRAALRDPAEDEEGGAHAVLLEQLENSSRVALDAGRQLAPLLRRDGVIHRVRMEVFLDVD